MIKKNKGTYFLHRAAAGKVDPDALPFTVELDLAIRERRAKRAEERKVKRVKRELKWGMRHPRPQKERAS